MRNFFRMLGCVSAVALTGCAPWTPPVTWKLPASNIEQVRQCVAGSINVCRPGVPAPLAAASASQRARLVDALDAQHDVTPATIQAGVVTIDRVSTSGAQALTASPRLARALEKLAALKAIHLPGASDVQLTAVAAAKAAQATSKPDACGELLKLSEGAAGTAGPLGGTEFSISRRSLLNCLEQVRNATALNGWSTSAAHYSAVAQSLAAPLPQDGSLNPADRARMQAVQEEQVDAAVRQALTMALTDAYMRAYFNGGDIFAVDLQVGTMKQNATDAVKKEFPLLKDDAAAVDALVDKLLKEAAGARLDPKDSKTVHLLVRKTNGGFISRSGGRYAFPGVSVSIDPSSGNPVGFSKVDFTQVGADLVRILIEAVGDAWSQLPADPGATAVNVKPALLTAYSEADSGVKQNDFAAINDWGAQAEGIVGPAVGQAIRGVSWVSLNNEALAKLIETAAGVAARKGVEKVAWCAYSCQAPGAPGKGLQSSLVENRMTLRIVD